MTQRYDNSCSTRCSEFWRAMPSFMGASATRRHRQVRTERSCSTAGPRSSVSA
jgi:hypothetical protein